MSAKPANVSIVVRVVEPALPEASQSQPPMIVPPPLPAMPVPLPATPVVPP